MTHRLYDYVGGKIWLDVDESSQMAARARSEYEPGKVRAMQDFLKPGMTFVDVGACHGYFTLLAAKLVGPTGRVLAFEPEPVNCGWLRRSILSNNYKNIDLIGNALGSSNGLDELALASRSGQHSFILLPTSGETILVRVLHYDFHDFPRVVNAIKIDAEGCELSILEGMRLTITASSPLLIMVDLHPLDPNSPYLKNFSWLSEQLLLPPYVESMGLEYIGIREAQS